MPQQHQPIRQPAANLPPVNEALARQRPIGAHFRRRAVSASAGFITFAFIWAASGSYRAALAAGLSVLIAVAILATAFTPTTRD